TYTRVYTALQRLQEVKFTTMEISFHDSSILDVSMEVIIDCNNNEVPKGKPRPFVRIIQTLGAIFKIRRKKFVEIHGRLHQAWDDYEEEKLLTTDLLRTISHINALGPSTAVHHV
ncbi:hypothetical protein DPMN_026321, partial [Dreissena polymorpha]